MVDARPGYQSRIPGISNYHCVPYLTPIDYVLYGTTTSCTPDSSSAICLPTAWTSFADGNSGITPPPAARVGLEPVGPRRAGHLR